ncbi:hypothetical protein RFI_11311 [Reticulomyxa filosa]|uniref:Uncharacterized protein n=1 Tax=Reticulomyxa filosa TaxID=46433 RepID=X6NHM4_RETFI|nr:hypothetical protein RFI_11311 [Reticulomyxa filosa]|eukprot:ETO25825.1 hypothetical protein RFI_11311 [Reticulomyxa filosa]
MHIFFFLCQFLMTNFSQKLYASLTTLRNIFSFEDINKGFRILKKIFIGIGVYIMPQIVILIGEIAYSPFEIDSPSIKELRIKIMEAVKNEFDYYNYDMVILNSDDRIVETDESVADAIDDDFGTFKVRFDPKFPPPISWVVVFTTTHTKFPTPKNFRAKKKKKKTENCLFVYLFICCNEQKKTKNKNKPIYK